jgi:hypothetical protein
MLKQISIGLQRVFSGSKLAIKEIVAYLLDLSRRYMSTRSRASNSIERKALRRWKPRAFRNVASMMQN